MRLLSRDRIIDPRGHYIQKLTPNTQWQERTLHGDPHRCAARGCSVAHSHQGLCVWNAPVSATCTQCSFVVLCAFFRVSTNTPASGVKETDSNAILKRALNFQTTRRPVWALMTYSSSYQSCHVTRLPTRRVMLTRYKSRSHKVLEVMTRNQHNTIQARFYDARVAC